MKLRHASTLVAAVVLGLSFAQGLRAQSSDPNSSAPAFAVASIKPSPPYTGQRAGVQVLPSGRVNLDQMTLKLVVLYAYDLREFQLSGGPAWMESDRFDIAAAAESDAALTTDQARAMVRTLLADRFGLQVEREVKDTKVHALVVDRGGSKLHESSAERFRAMFTIGKFSAAKSDVAALARYLSMALREPVVDETGLTGTYDFTLEAQEIGSEFISPGQAPPDSLLALPTLSSALPAQLGLRLQTKQGKVDYIVVRRALKPSDN